jgi:carbamoyl-phosphate synthase large subunit
MARTPQPIIQKLAHGREFTVNFFSDRNGTCLAAIPHWRVETRSGEVSKCVTVKQRTLMELADRLSCQLPGAWGPMCYQAFVDDNGRVSVIEINARFGGGYPVARQAGADFVRWLLDDAQGRSLPPPSDAWNADVVMMRWETAVFTTAKDVGLCA